MISAEELELQAGIRARFREYAPEVSVIEFLSYRGEDQTYRVGIEFRRGVSLAEAGPHTMAALRACKDELFVQIRIEWRRHSQSKPIPLRCPFCDSSWQSCRDRPAHLSLVQLQ